MYMKMTSIQVAVFPLLDLTKPPRPCILHAEVMKWSWLPLQQDKMFWDERHAREEEALAKGKQDDMETEKECCAEGKDIFNWITETAKKKKEKLQNCKDSEVKQVGEDAQQFQMEWIRIEWP